MRSIVVRLLLVLLDVVVVAPYCLVVGHLGPGSNRNEPVGGQATETRSYPQKISTLDTLETVILSHAVIKIGRK